MPYKSILNSTKLVLYIFMFKQLFKLSEKHIKEKHEKINLSWIFNSSLNEC